MAYHYIGGVILGSFQQPAPAKTKLAAKGAKPAAKKPAATGEPRQYDIVFTNQETGAEIKLTIPARGAMHDPKAKTKLSTVHEIEKEVLEIIKKHLD